MARAENLTRYRTNPPAGAIVLYDQNALEKFVVSYSHTGLYNENGGYYMKTPDGEIVAIIGDELSAELDARIARAEEYTATHDENEGEEACTHGART